jgi:alanine-glyoxylate transaminase / (R)-3-amino-2-methylpropionate-pyruvate transaminase
LQQNAHKIGTFLLEELSKINSQYIGDIRGKGLMIGVELVKNKKELLSKEKINQIFENIKEKGILLGKGGLKGNILRIKPPMCINIQDATKCVEAISEVLKCEE